jgi:hypothetical protein
MPILKTAMTKAIDPNMTFALTKACNKPNDYDALVSG